MNEVIDAFALHTLGRLADGQGLRLFLQACIAIGLGMSDGIHEARRGSPPHLLGFAVDRRLGPGKASHTWERFGRVLITAFLVDFLYQFMRLDSLYPLEALTIAAILAPAPYFLARGLSIGIARRARIGRRRLYVIGGWGVESPNRRSLPD
jgi:hypothetical protein